MMVLPEHSASLSGAGMGARQAALVQGKGACAEASGAVGGSSAQVNVALEGARVMTFGPLEEVGETAADGLLDTSLSAQVEAGREGGQSRDPAEGSL